MEMERINDHTVKISIENQDLEERGIALMDLFGDPSKVEDFFRGILEELDLEEQFADSGAVTFQVMPNVDGLEVYVTKNWSEDHTPTFDDEVMKRLFETIQDASSHRAEVRKKESPKPKKKEEKANRTLDEIIRFDSIEDFFDLCKVYRLKVQEASLYLYKGQYYLHVVDLVDEKEDMTYDSAMFLEYGERSPITASVIAEYGKLIMAHQAFDIARKYFK